MTNKEQVRIQQIDRLAQDIRIIDHAHQTGASALAEALYDAGYRLQPSLDVSKLTVIGRDEALKLCYEAYTSGESELPEEVKRKHADVRVYVDMNKLLDAQLSHTKQQIKEMMEGK